MTALSRRGFLVASAGLLAAAPLGPAPRAAADRLSTLRAVVRGRVLLPGDPGFDGARTPWKLSVDQSVRAVVEVADVDDAAALVRFARDSGFAVAAQPNGHGASPALGGTILVRTGSLNEVRVDSVTASARVGAGVSWGPVQAAAASFGLLGLSGSAPNVSVTGYTLGGGLSWFSRRYGWAASSVTAVEGLAADGDRFRATPTTEPDLYWALRGGGGDYALVTTLEFALHREPSIFGGSVVWPLAQANAVLSAFGAVTVAAPDELTVWLKLSKAPGGPPTVAIHTTYLGDSETALKLLRPFDGISGQLLDTRRPLSSNEIGTIANEPSSPSQNHLRASLLNELTEDIVDAFGAAAQAGLFNVVIRHLDGALARRSEIPAGSIHEPYLAVALAGSPTTLAAAPARLSDYFDGLAQVATGRVPFNFLAPEQDAQRAFSTEVVDRLRDIASRHDPHGVFRSNHPVTL